MGRLYICGRPGALWSIRALAEEFDLDRQTVARRLEGVPPDGLIQAKHPGWRVSSVDWRLRRAPRPRSSVEGRTGP